MSGLDEANSERVRMNVSAAPAATAKARAVLLRENCRTCACCTNDVETVKGSPDQTLVPPLK